MITGLKINGTSFSTGILHLLSEDSNLSVQGTDTGITIQPVIPQDIFVAGSTSDSISQTSPYISRIQGIQPDQQGNIFLLGDYCISLTDHTDNSDPDSVPKNEHQITIFDGCSGCNTCKDQWRIQDMAQTCLLWMVGLKDCIIHYEPAAARLWQQMLQKYVLQVQHCGSSELSDKEFRSRQYGKAVKLLYQYKATVAMWNYLIYTTAGTMQVLQAAQDYCGFVIQAKRRIDMCGSSDSSSNQTVPVQLWMKATLQSGQLASVLAQKNNIMRLFIMRVDQNTYMQYGKDTGNLVDQLDTTNIDSDFQIRTTQSGGVQVQMTLQYAPEKPCNVVFSGAWKILPTIQLIEEDSGDTTQPLTLQQYAKIRYAASDFSMEEQIKTNRWRIDVAWIYDLDNMKATKENTLQSTYFVSAYCKYPEQDSDSE